MIDLPASCIQNMCRRFFYAQREFLSVNTARQLFLKLVLAACCGPQQSFLCRA